MPTGAGIQVHPPAISTAASGSATCSESPPQTQQSSHDGANRSSPQSQGQVQGQGQGQKKGQGQTHVVKVGFYDVQHTIGKGNYAVVKYARHRVTRTEVAIKIIDKTRLDENNLEKMYREIRVLKMLNHPHIIKLYQVMETKNMLYLVTEYAAKGEIFDYVAKKGRLGEAEAKAKFAQILSAVECCHRMHIVHRDLKAENLLLDENNDIKIADFGFTNFFRPSENLATFCGSPPYAAPEVFEGKKYLGPEIDVWSLGVVLYVLVCGALPFEAADLQALRHKVLDGRFRVPYFMTTDCEQLIRKMLTVDPAKRWSLQQVKNHRWIKQAVLDLPSEAKICPSGPRTLAPDGQPQHEHIIKSMQNMGIDGNRTRESLQNDAYDNFAAIYLLLLDRWQTQCKITGANISQTQPPPTIHQSAQPQNRGAPPTTTTSTVPSKCGAASATVTPQAPSIAGDQTPGASRRQVTAPPPSPVAGAGASSFDCGQHLAPNLRQQAPANWHQHQHHNTSAGGAGGHHVVPPGARPMLASLAREQGIFHTLPHTANLAQNELTLGATTTATACLGPPAGAHWPTSVAARQAALYQTGSSTDSHTESIGSSGYSGSTAYSSQLSTSGGRPCLSRQSTQNTVGSIDETGAWVNAPPAPPAPPPVHVYIAGGGAPLQQGYQGQGGYLQQSEMAAAMSQAVAVGSPIANRQPLASLLAAGHPPQNQPGGHTHQNPSDPHSEATPPGHNIGTMPTNSFQPIAQNANLHNHAAQSQLLHSVIAAMNSQMQGAGNSAALAGEFRNPQAQVAFSPTPPANNRSQLWDCTQAHSPSMQRHQGAPPGATQHSVPGAGASGATGDPGAKVGPCEQDLMLSLASWHLRGINAARIAELHNAGLGNSNQAQVSPYITKAMLAAAKVATVGVCPKSPLMHLPGQQQMDSGAGANPVQVGSGTCLPSRATPTNLHHPYQLPTTPTNTVGTVPSQQSHRKWSSHRHRSHHSSTRPGADCAGGGGSRRSHASTQCTPCASPQPPGGRHQCCFRTGLRASDTTVYDLTTSSSSTHFGHLETNQRCGGISQINRPAAGDATQTLGAQSGGAASLAPCTLCKPTTPTQPSCSTQPQRTCVHSTTPNHPNTTSPNQQSFAGGRIRVCRRAARHQHQHHAVAPHCATIGQHQGHQSTAVPQQLHPQHGLQHAPKRVSLDSFEPHKFIAYKQSVCVERKRLTGDGDAATVSKSVDADSSISGASSVHISQRGAHGSLVPEPVVLAPDQHGAGAGAGGSPSPLIRQASYTMAQAAPVYSARADSCESEPVNASEPGGDVETMDLS